MKVISPSKCYVHLSHTREVAAMDKALATEEKMKMAVEEMEAVKEEAKAMGRLPEEEKKENGQAPP